MVPIETLMGRIRRALDVAILVLMAVGLVIAGFFLLAVCLVVEAFRAEPPGSADGAHRDRDPDLEPISLPPKSRTSRPA